MNAVKRCLFFIFMFFLTLFPSIAGAADVDTSLVPGSENKRQTVVPNDSAGSTDVLRVGIDDFVQLVRQRNDRIMFHRLEWKIADQTVLKNRSVFETEFVAGIMHETNRQRNTVEDAIGRSSLDEFNERNMYYNAGVERQIQTGAKVSLGVKLEDLSNNLQDSVFEDDDYNEYKSFMGLTLVQPLLKNRGKDATLADIRVAESDRDIAFQRYRKEMMAVVAEAAAAYWDLLGEQEKYNIRKDSVRIGERILADNKLRVSEGRMAETEVLEAEASLALRHSLVSAAQQDIASAVNKVRDFIFSTVTGKWVDIEAMESLEKDDETPDFDHSLRSALALRPEYLAGKIKLDREDIRVAYHQNQRWPQLDLKASYGLNGLDDNAGDSWDDAFDAAHESWSIGLELRVPLGGGQRSRSELQAAKLRKQQSILELKATEVVLTNNVDTQVKNVLGSMDQVVQYNRIVDKTQRLLAVELARLDEGQSTSRLVLDREEALIRAKEDALKRMVEKQKAVIALKKAEGSLLKHYGISETTEEAPNGQEQ